MLGSCDRLPQGKAGREGSTLGGATVAFGKARHWYSEVLLGYMLEKIHQVRTQAAATAYSQRPYATTQYTLSQQDSPETLLLRRPQVHVADADKLELELQYFNLSTCRHMGRATSRRAGMLFDTLIPSPAESQQQAASPATTVSTQARTSANFGLKPNLYLAASVVSSPGEMSAQPERLFAHARKVTQLLDLQTLQEHLDILPGKLCFLHDLRHLSR